MKGYCDNDNHFLGVELAEFAYEKMSSNLVGISSSAPRHARPGIATGEPITSPLAPDRRLRSVFGEMGVG